MTITIRGLQVAEVLVHDAKGTRAVGGGFTNPGHACGRWTPLAWRFPGLSNSGAASRRYPVAAGRTTRPHAEHQPSEDGAFRVFLDPVGHPFCLIR